MRPDEPQNPIPGRHAPDDAARRGHVWSLVGSWPWPARAAGYFVLHAAATMLGIALVLQPAGQSVFWPATGLLLGVLLITDARDVPWIVVTGLVASVIVSWGHDWWISRAAVFDTSYLHFPLGTSAIALVAWGWLRWRLGRDRWSVHDAAVALTTVTLVAAIGALSAVVGFGRLGTHPSFLEWQLWWISDLLGVLAVAPAILTLWLERQRQTVVPDNGSRRELVLLVVTAVLIAAVVFGNAAGAGVWRSPYALVPVFLWASLRFRPRVVAWLNAAVALVASIAARQQVGAFATDGDGQLAAAVPLQFFLIVMFASAMLLAVAVQDRRISLVDARAADARRRDAVRRLTRTEEEVRRRTAEDLHDGISQTLLGARFTLEAALREGQPQAWRSSVSHAVELITRAQDDTRDLIRDMSPPGLQQFGLGPTLGQLGGELGRKAGLSVSVHLQGDTERLEPTAAAVLYRWTRELLVNVAKHAGVTDAAVRIDADANEISLRVEDDGRGFDARRWLDEPAVAASFGLRSIVDRVTALGGRFDVDSRPNDGCRIALHVPRAAVGSADVSAPGSGETQGIGARRRA